MVAIGGPNYRGTSVVLVDDLTPGRDLPAPMDVRVEGVDWNAGESRRAIVELGDAIGNELRLIDYEGAEISLNWQPGQWYRIANCGVNEGGGGYALELAPSKKTRIEPLYISDESTKLFVFGDTHVGYRHRSGKAPGASAVDNRESFTEALSRARASEVDAVVHAGDIFDHNTVGSDLDTVYEEVSRTIEGDIPFYFVTGNHDKPAGRALLRRLVSDHGSCVQLGQDPVHFETSQSLVYGFDFTGKDLPDLPTPSPLNRSCKNILVIHDTPYPVVDEDGNSIYKSDGPDLRKFLTRSSIRPDLIIAGHMHRGSLGVVKGFDVPVLTTGPTAPINDSPKDNAPSTWSVRLWPDHFEIDRKPL